MDSQPALLRALQRPELAPAMAVGALGCGAGQRCRLWALRGHQVYGVDRDPARIALARRLSLGLDAALMFDLAQAQALPWPGRSMDLCLVHRALLGTPTWAACVAEVARVLRPGGAALLGGPSWDASAALLARYGLGARAGSPLAFKRA